MKLSLVVMNAGKSAGQVIPINLAQFVIGRDAQCNLRPGSALISKRHCAILVRNGEVFVRDFESTNGTFVNDSPLKGETVVKNGDVLKAGPLHFRIAIEGVAKPASKTPTPAPASPKKPTPLAPNRGSHDEDAAALLLGMEDETDFGARDESGVPEGSTVMDVPINLPGTEDTATVKMPAPGATPAASGSAKPEEKKKIEVGTAQAAAKAILEKFNRRSR